jgi:TonB family protein
MKNRLAVALLYLLAVQPFVATVASAQEAAEADRKIVTKVIPDYPNIARAMHIQGSVRIDVLIEPNGKAKSFDAKGGHPVLVQSAEDALRQWKWEPTSRETHQLIELRFTP